jgi:DNA-binding transcriptional LysR family regulator
MEYAMDVADLRCFVEVALACSFSRAAVRLHVTAPAVSKTVKKLEEELGVALFERTTRQVTLTPHGERLLAQARGLLEGFAALPAAVLRPDGEIAGPVRLAAMEVFSVYLLPKALSTVVAAHPDLQPHVYEMVPQRMEGLLLEGRLDAAFTIGRARSQGIDSRSLGASPGVLVCGRSHPLYRRGRVHRGALTRFPSVVPEFFEMEHAPRLDQFPDDAVPRRVGATIELLQMMIELAIEGAYLGYFPEISVRPYLADGRLRRLRGMPRATPFDLQVWTWRRFPPKPAVAAVITAIEGLLRAR